MARKKPRARRSFTRQFKADIVPARGPVGQVAKDVDLTETAYENTGHAVNQHDHEPSSQVA